MIKSIFQKIRQNHFLAMVLCCAIPLVGIWALSSLGVLESTLLNILGALSHPSEGEMLVSE